jgi:DNA-binding Xre family transcriptional regulator
LRRLQSDTSQPVQWYTLPPPIRGVERWQYDLWFQIIRANLDGHPEQVDLTYHPALQLPAMSRYSVTTPVLERWFKQHNANRPYEDRVKPFNFISGFQASHAMGEEMFIIGNGSKMPRRTKLRPLRPIAPYSETSMEALVHVFDRETGKPIPARQLKTYAQALAQYHLRPEAKFENGDYLDCGPTRRRHIQAIQINYIGKEANRWEEQFFLGMDEDAVIDYGADLRAATLFDELSAAIGKFGKPELASHIGVSRNSLTKIFDAKGKNMSPRLTQKIGSAIAALNFGASEEKKLLELVRVEVANIGMSELARRLQVDASNLSKIVNGKRNLSRQLAAKLDSYFRYCPAS